LVPVAAVAVVAGVGGLGPVVADASPNLPGITAQDLLAKVQSAKVDGLSGTVRSTTNLGLPALPDVGGHSGNATSTITGLLTGDHTARVAFAGPNKAKVSLLDNMGERVWTSNGTTAWAYDSQKHEATKLNVPAGSTKPEATPEKSYDPQAVAKQILAAIDPTTKVQVTGTEEVAGRDAYKLRLVPKTDKTTVGSVTLAVDSRNWVPLQITVMPRTGSDPAVQLGFSAVSFNVPAASTFAFTPPAGTKVTDQQLPSRTPDSKATPPKNAPQDKPSGEKQSGAKPTVIGTGWDSVVVLHGQVPSGAGALDQLLANAPTVQGSWGTGKVLTSKMVSALITNDGRILVGLVPPSVLESTVAKAPR
jgi:outer membrane lipoprotein-sorting protein